MANKKLVDLTPKGTAPATGDLFLITDIADITDSISGTSKKVTYGQMVSGIQITTNQITDITNNFSQLNHVHDAAHVTTGQFANARISQSSVTQHQAALAIAPTQVTNFNSTVRGLVSVGAEGTPSGNGAIAYNGTNGEFTYTPPTAAGIGASGDTHIHNATEITNLTQFIQNTISTGITVGPEAPAAGDGDITFNATTRVLTYTPPTPAGIGAAPLVHTHDTSHITTGQFADARISQSSVTQHQGSLTIGTTQVTGLEDYIQTRISVNPTENVASADGGISYDNISGVLTYTPPTISGLGGTPVGHTHSTGDITNFNNVVRGLVSVGAEGLASDNGAIAYNPTNGLFTYTPPTPIGIGAADRIHGHVSADITDLSNTIRQYLIDNITVSEGIADSDGGLVFNSTTGEFTYTPPTPAGIGAAPIVHTHDAGQIITGQFADARISQSSVTQHQGSLTIGTTQISNFNAAVRGLVSVGTEAAASGNGSIGYDNGTGILTYTPPTAAGIGASSLGHTHVAANITDFISYGRQNLISAVNEVTAVGDGALTYDQLTGILRYTPALVNFNSGITTLFGGLSTTTPVITDFVLGLKSGALTKFTVGSLGAGGGGGGGGSTFDNVVINNNLSVGGNTNIAGNTIIEGLTTINDNLIVNGNLSVSGTITGNLTGNVVGNLTGNVTGNVTGNATTATQVTSLANHTTTNLAEGANLYFTNARARGAISLVTDAAVSGGALTYNATTGVLTFSPDSNPGGGGTGATTLDGLTDVTIGSVVANSILFNSAGGAGQWTNITLSAAVAATPIANLTVTGTITGNLTGNVTGNLTGNVVGNLTGNVTGNATTATTANQVTSLANHTTTNLAEGTNLYFTNTRARGAISVTTAAAVSGGALSYNNSTGVLTFNPDSNPGGGGATTLDQLNDVTLTTPVSNQVISYDGVTGQWINRLLNGTSVSLSLDDLNNVTAPSPLTNDIITFNSGTGLWTNTTLAAALTASGISLGGGGATNLDGLSDVTMTSPTTGQVLAYSGTQWVNRVLTTADINSGVFNIARIPTGTTSTTVSLGDHSHNGTYVPTAGGTVTGDLTINGQTNALGGLVVGNPEIGSYVEGSHVCQIIADAATKSPLTLVGGNGVNQIWKDSSPTIGQSFGLCKPGDVIGNDLVFASYNTTIGWAERIRVLNSNGNLGIGTIAPTQKLDVAGNARVVGNIDIAGVATNGLIFPDGTKLTTANHVHPITQVSINGTNIVATNASASTFLAGNGTWSTPAAASSNAYTMDSITAPASTNNGLTRWTTPVPLTNGIITVTANSSYYLQPTSLAAGRVSTIYLNNTWGSGELKLLFSRDIQWFGLKPTLYNAVSIDGVAKDVAGFDMNGSSDAVISITSLGTTLAQCYGIMIRRNA